MFEDMSKETSEMIQNVVIVLVAGVLILTLLINSVSCINQEQDSTRYNLCVSTVKENPDLGVIADCLILLDRPGVDQ